MRWFAVQLGGVLVYQLQNTTNVKTHIFSRLKLTFSFDSILHIPLPLYLLSSYFFFSHFLPSSSSSNKNSNCPSDYFGRLKAPVAGWIYTKIFQVTIRTKENQMDLPLLCLPVKIPRFPATNIWLLSGNWCFWNYFLGFCRQDSGFYSRNKRWTDFVIWVCVRTW